MRSTCLLPMAWCCVVWDFSTPAMTQRSLMSWLSMFWPWSLPSESEAIELHELVKHNVRCCPRRPVTSRKWLEVAAETIDDHQCILNRNSGSFQGETIHTTTYMIVQLFNDAIVRLPPHDASVTLSFFSDTRVYSRPEETLLKQWLRFVRYVHIMCDISLLPNNRLFRTYVINSVKMTCCSFPLSPSTSAFFLPFLYLISKL